MLVPPLAAHVHAASQKAEATLYSKLRKAKAVSRASAQPLDRLGRAERAQLDRLVRDGVVVQTGTAYYLDEALLSSRRREGMRLALLIFVAVSTAVVAGVLIGLA